MGSDGPKTVTIHVTGFKKFQGVAENPTETIVNNLKNFVEKRGLPANVTLGSCNVLETAGIGAMPTLYKIMESSVNSKSVNESDEHVIWLHLGVNTGAWNFAIEKQAVNEATFFSPDELGWEPEELPIVSDDGGISRTRETTCCVEGIIEFLLKEGYEVKSSNDAGLFVCNYVYYQSLRFAEERKGHKSLFVHVPGFVTINEETQMQFTAALLEAIAYTS